MHHISCICVQYFPNSYTTLGHITATAQIAHACRVVQPTCFSFNTKFVLYMTSFKYLTCQKGLVVSLKMFRLIFKSRNHFFLAADFHRLLYTDVTAYSNNKYQGKWNMLRPQGGERGSGPIWLGHIVHFCILITHQLPLFNWNESQNIVLQFR